MTTFTEAYQRYDRSNRDNRADLWTLCECTYEASQVSTIVQLADIIGRGEDTVADWNRVGWLIAYCDEKYHHTDNGVVWSLKDLWEFSTDALSYDHLLRIAKQAKRHELDPLEVLERLYHAMDGQKAESLERDIEEAHEPQDALLRRDIKRIGARLKQNIESLEFRGASNKLVRAFRVLEGRMAQELERLTLQGNDEK